MNLLIKSTVYLAISLVSARVSATILYHFLYIIKRCPLYSSHGRVHNVYQKLMVFLSSYKIFVLQVLLSNLPFLFILDFQCETCVSGNGTVLIHPPDILCSF